MTLRRTCSLVPLLLACTTPAPEEEEDPAPRCRRLEVLVEDRCEAVQIASVATRDFAFERAGWRIEGTLWMPSATEPDYLPPGVVIMHGSGPNGRAGLIEGHLGVVYAEPIPVYASLAEQLAARGFAVLSYDKRSCFVEVKPECRHSIYDYPDVDTMLVTDFLEDARVAAQTLAAEPDVADDVIVIGHSEGGTFVPMLINQEEVVHAGVMLAGPTLSLRDTMAGQYDDLADWLEANSPGDPIIEQLRAEAEAIRTTIDAIIAGTYPHAHYLGATVEQWLDWIALLDAFPSEIAALDGSLSAHFGGLDFNVGPDHYNRFRAWVDAGVVDADLYIHPDLTHAFVHIIDDPPGHTTEFSPEVVDDIVAWAVESSPGEV